MGEEFPEPRTLRHILCADRKLPIFSTAIEVWLFILLSSHIHRYSTLHTEETVIIPSYSSNFNPFFLVTDSMRSRDALSAAIFMHNSYIVFRCFGLRDTEETAEGSGRHLQIFRAIRTASRLCKVFSRKSRFVCAVSL